MQRNKTSKSSQTRSAKNERGIALITVMLLLMLLTALTLAMAWSTQGDMLTSGFYRNFRGSFYAADSGLNIVRQAMKNDLSAGGILVGPLVAGGAVPGGPLQSPATENALSNDLLVTKGYGQFQPVTGAGQGQAINSWPEQFKVVNLTFALLPGTTGCSASPVPLIAPPVGGWNCNNLPAGPATFTYTYDYQLTVQGQSRGTENTQLFDHGQLQIIASTAVANANLPFSAFGMFINNYALCANPLVQGTLTGPVFTNGSWNFGAGGIGYTFTDPVGSFGPTAGYENGGCTPGTTSGAGITPNFKKGFTTGQPKVPLPADSFNQERAVLDGKGGTTAVTDANRTAVLKDIAKAPFPGGAAPGVFLPYTSVAGVNTFTGGGITVEGDATVTLSPAATCNATTCAQIYNITNNGVTTTVTVDPKVPNPLAFGGVGTTTVSDGGVHPQLVINGIPRQKDPITGVDKGYATMLYVNGKITNLVGPGQGQPAIQDGTALTITSTSDITITGDILYKAEPVTLTANGSIPADQLIPGNDTREALGIFTATGNVVMDNKQPVHNLEIDATIATISANGTGGMKGINTTIDNLTIVGGRIQNEIYDINTTHRNVMFDVRYKDGNFAPPWFPSTPVIPTGINPPPSFQPPQVSRLQWTNKTASY